MIDLYVGPTPNGQKVAILLEELGMPYQCHKIDILRGDQLTPEFLKINPNNKQPAIVDPDGPAGQPITLWESCAILVYLAEKSGGFLPDDPAERAQVMKWLFFQASTQGPMSGQYAHFAFYAAPEHQYPYAIERYLSEMNRQLGLLDRHLGGREFMVDSADMALLPYAITAVVRGLSIMQNQIRKETIAGGLKGYGEEHRDILFGHQQFDERDPL